MAANDPALRKAIARRAAYAMHAKHGIAVTKPGRDAVERSFVDKARAAAPLDATEADIRRLARPYRSEFYAGLQVAKARKAAERRAGQ